jgi:predicted  nucleic acid-binding Zn-ribbon protein
MAMREQIERRLQELHQEYDAGTKLLSDLESRRANIQATLTRISGAIQVLEEELAKADQLGNGGIKVGAGDALLGHPDQPPASA